MTGISMIATGRSAPKHIVTNDDLSQNMETSDEWIRTRTGIQQRHFSTGETNYEIALQAVQQALDRAKIDKKDIGILITATFTPDYQTPSVACILQQQLELEQDVMSFDLNAACSGFLYSLTVAKALLQQSKKTYAVVVGSEKISSRLDMNDRGTAILFGDGAGAVIIKLEEEKQFCSVLKSSGNVQMLGCTNHELERPHIFMNGKEVFKSAVSNISKVSKECVLQAGMTFEDIDYVICHQANERIIQAVIKMLKVPEEKFYMNIARYGNTSAASIPIALDEMFEQQMLHSGMKVLLTGFGAGYTWGAVMIEL